MHVAGFTFVKNAVKLQYPLVEAIRSVLPLCQDFYVAVGDCNDGTRELAASIDPVKIKIIDTVWNSALHKDGAVYADETNKAYQAIPDSADWCFYIQGDEVLHEKYHDPVYQSMLRWKDDQQVDGLLFNYLHFYGSYDYVGTDSSWYRHEIRVVRKRKDIYSYRDAQGFRKGNDEKLRVKASGGTIYHYGWVREPKAMQAKKARADAMYRNDDMEQAETIYSGDFDYDRISALEKFNGTHPEVMQQRIASLNWKFEKDLSANRYSLKDRFKNAVEKLTGVRPFDYKNYRLLK